MKGLSAKAQAELVADWERGTWQYKAIAATNGNRTKLGMILLAVLGIAPSNAPRLVCPTAVIDANGWVWSWFQSPDDPPGVADQVPLVSTTNLRDSLNKLADRIKMTDAQREELFSLVRKWIERDERAIQEDFLSARAVGTVS